MKITLNYVSVSIEGDYYQVHFSANKDNGSSEITDDPYFLIQPQFEMPDGGEVYIESHDDNYIGHYLVSVYKLPIYIFVIPEFSNRVSRTY
jgi:hypothetical protein